MSDFRVKNAFITFGLVVCLAGSDCWASVSVLTVDGLVLMPFSSDFGESVSSVASSFSISSLVGFSSVADFFVDLLVDFLEAGVFLVVFDALSDFADLTAFVADVLVAVGVLVRTGSFSGVFVPFFFVESSVVVGDSLDVLCAGDDGVSDCGEDDSEPLVFDPLVSVVGEFVDVRFFLLSTSGLAESKIQRLLSVTRSHSFKPFTFYPLVRLHRC